MQVQCLLSEHERQRPVVKRRYNLEFYEEYRNMYGLKSPLTMALAYLLELNISLYSTRKIISN